MAKDDLKNLSLRSIADEERKLKKKRKKIMIPCRHTGKKGNPKGSMRGQKFVCDMCGAEFGVTRISMDELKEAAATIHDAINQIKMLSDGDSKDDGIIEVLGNTDFNISEICDLYDNMTTSRKNKKKNKNKGNRDIRNGGYTDGRAISFVDAGYKKKRSYY